MTAPCAIAGCGRTDLMARGLCNMHYHRWRADSPHLHTPGGIDPDAVIPHGTAGPVPPCPRAHGTDPIRLWSTDDGRRWYCARCRRVFSGAPVPSPVSLAGFPGPAAPPGDGTGAPEARPVPAGRARRSMTKGAA